MKLLKSDQNDWFLKIVSCTKIAWFETCHHELQLGFLQPLQEVPILLLLLLRVLPWRKQARKSKSYAGSKLRRPTRSDWQVWSEELLA